MLRFLLVRLVRALVTIVLVVTFAFIVLRLAGDPATVLLGADAPPDMIEGFRRDWGLDQPILVQYALYFRSIAVGDLGFSMRDGRPAIDIVLERVPATLMLTLPAFALALLIGVPAGIYAALHRNSVVDRTVMIVAVTGFAMPNFIVALLLALVFSVTLGWLPSGGQGTVWHMILPVVTIGTGSAAVLARFTRSSMLDVLSQPYIRTGHAKGAARPTITWWHALPNAAIPTLTIMGFMVGGLIAGAVITESVFSWPGIGRLLVVSVASRDLAVVQTILLLIAVTMVTANFLVDVIYALIDPRMRSTVHAS